MSQSRDLSVNLLAQIEAGTLKPRLFFEAQFKATGSPATPNYLRLWSGQGSIDWNGSTWAGAGGLLTVAGIEETTESRSVGFEVTLTGLRIDFIDIALQDTQQGLPGRIWLGALAADGTVVVDPYLARAGRMNIPAIQDSGQTVTISAAFEDENAALLIPLNRRWTPEDQHIDYPDDDGFDFVAGLQDKQVMF